MPWVFTYNDWSAGTEYEYMVKAAVTSAIEAARMKPFCMYSGSEAAPMHKWLVKKGVRIIRVRRDGGQQRERARTLLGGSALGTSSIWVYWAAANC